jgi:transposase
LTERQERQLLAARKNKGGFDLTLSYPIVGIDISSTTLDVAELNADGTFKASSFANTKVEARKLARRLAKIGAGLVVVEATGGYELIAMAALAVEEVPVARVNPRQVRHFAKGIGRLAKTDPIDARVLAIFGERARPRVTTLPSKEEARLKALSLRRRQLVDARVAEKNHRGKIVEKDIKAGVERVIESLDSEIEMIEEAIAEHIAACEPMRARQQLLESIPCVAAATSGTVLAELPELGQRSTSVLKALVGVAPFNSDSGGMTGQRHIEGGRAPLRQALYMAAQTGYRCNPILKSFYERLRGKGKSHKQAIVACIGKLVSIMNAIIKTGTPFNAKVATA